MYGQTKSFWQSIPLGRRNNWNNTTLNNTEKDQIKPKGTNIFKFFAFPLFAKKELLIAYNGEVVLFLRQKHDFL